jgi:hypothetical protein
LTELAAMSLGATAQTTADVAFVIIGGGAAAFGVYLLVLSIAALFQPGYQPPRTRPRARLVILVPAHDEAALIGRCVRSLRTQTYPPDLYDVVVVADNCTDDTAVIAARAGAHVMVRIEPAGRGKGRALRWAMDRVLTERPGVDALVVVDADSVADRGFLTALVKPFDAGIPAVQGESLLAEDGSPQTALRVAAFLLFNRVRAAGRDVLGLPAFLTGTGMLLARGLLLKKPWSAFTSAEDVEYSLELRLAGVEIGFAPGAVLLSPPAPNSVAADEQQLRWEGGKAHLAKTWLRRLTVRALRDRRPLLLLTAFDLALPPLGLLAAGVLAGTAVGTSLAFVGALSTWVLVPWLLALGSIPLSVVIGLKAGNAPPSGYRAMARAPLFILAKVPRAHRLWGYRGDRWVRTERAGHGADHVPDGPTGPMSTAESGQHR